MQAVMSIADGSVIVFNSTVHADDRGSLFEAYRVDKFNPVEVSSGIFKSFVQQNISISKNGVARGFHRQVGLSKLVTVVRGRIMDCVVDTRHDSPLFGVPVSIILPSGSSIWIPEYFLHGYQALEHDTVLLYNYNKTYNKNLEKHVHLYSFGRSIFPKPISEVSQADTSHKSFTQMYKEQ